MNGFKIKVLKSKLDSYWRADRINNECWAKLEDIQKDFTDIPEGIFDKEYEYEYVDESSPLLINTYTTAIKLDR